MLLELLLPKITWAVIICIGLLVGPAALKRLKQNDDAKPRVNVLKLWKFIISRIRVRINTWRYLIDGPDMIQHAYDQAGGQPFELNAPDNRYVFVSSVDQIKELNSAGDDILSLHAASKQMLQPMYTMHGFNWFDRRGTEGLGVQRAVRTLLTNGTPRILPDLADAIAQTLTSLREQHPIVNGTKHTPLYPTIIKLTVLANAYGIFGRDLARNEEFTEAALRYVEDTLKTAEIVRLVPKWAAPYVGKLVSGQLAAQKAVYAVMVPAIEKRLQEQTLQKLGHPVEKHDDIISYIIECAPKKTPWSAGRITHEVMAIWFGSIHAISTTVAFALEDLCLHPEYIDPIRKEVQSSQWSQFINSANGLPLLDSFIKESARITPVESMGTRRHALVPFQLADGTKLEVGDWACTPVRAMIHNPEFYPYPDEFNGFRFADPKLLSKDHVNFKFPQPEGPSKLTDGNDNWHVWGTGRMICPGRFYASAVMKLIVGHFVRHYDCELVDPTAPRWFIWRSSMLPRNDTKIVLRPRNLEDSLKV